jgi:hypothetical protein
MIKHKFHSEIPDSTDTTIVRPSNWNDEHDITNGIATLDVNGTAVVTNTEVTIAEKIFLTRQSGRSNMAIYVSSVNPGIDFTITSLGTADDAGLNIGWIIV